MAEEHKGLKKLEEVGIGFHGHSVTVRSSTESLDKVKAIADEILTKILKGIVNPDESQDERLRKLGLG